MQRREFCKIIAATAAAAVMSIWTNRRRIGTAARIRYADRRLCPVLRYSGARAALLRAGERTTCPGKAR